MKKLDLNEFSALNTENVAAIKIQNGEVTILYMIEYWEMPWFDCGDDQYRFYYYGDVFVKNDWRLDNNELSEIGLIKAVVMQQGRCCGGMYYYHEEDGRENGQTVFQHFYKEVTSNVEESISILEMSNNEWMTQWKTLNEGIYIVVITE